MPVETWQTLIDLNLTSTFVCTKILGGAMIGRGRGGRIINVASVSGLIANRGIGGRSYETGKAAVIAFTRAVAADWAPHRITVNAIAPGGFMTAPNLRWKSVNPAIIETFKAQVPMGEYGEPEDLAPARRLPRERRLPLHDRGGPRHRRRLHALVVGRGGDMSPRGPTPRTAPLAAFGSTRLSPGRSPPEGAPIP